MSSQAIDVTVVRDFAALEPRKRDWNALVARAHTNTVFQTYECHASWCRVFGVDRQLLIDRRAARLEA